MKDRTPPLSAQKNQLTTNEQPIPDSKLASYLNQDLEWWFEAKPGANCIQKSTKFLLNACPLEGRFLMPRRRFTPGQIIQHLREAEVLLSQDKTIAQACKAIGVTEQTYYRWRKEYGGVRTDQAKRLKDLEK